MINPSSEKLYTIPEAAKNCPGGPVSRSTMHRWFREGLKGKKLETICRGGVRMTSEAALYRFFSAVTEAADSQSLSAVA